MRIAIISTMDGANWGGSEELWAAMAREALAAGHQVAASVVRWRPQAPAIQQLADAGVKVFERPRWPSARLGRVAERVRFRFAPILNFHPDVLCISQGATYDLVHSLDPAGIDRLTGDLPYVLICQYNSDETVPDEATRPLATNVFARAYHVAFVSEQNLSAARRQTAAELPNAVILRNPVNLSDTAPVPFPAGDATRFASVARLDVRYKGQDMLLEVLSRSPWRERDWELALCGGGPDENSLKKLTADLGLAERVKFMGHVTDIRGVWAGNQMLLMPSRGEGAPLALVEAMLCARPAVVTDVGGNGEWIEDGMTGFIADAPTPRSLAAALERAWSARAQWPAMGLQAHEAAARRIDPAPGRSLLNMLIQAAGKRGSGG